MRASRDTTNAIDDVCSFRDNRRVTRRIPVRHLPVRRPFLSPRYQLRFAGRDFRGGMPRATAPLAAGENDRAIIRETDVPL